MNKGKKSILVVDDDVVSITVLSGILEKEYTVYVTKNGTAAVKVAKKNQPDVILLDIVMPEMDGYDVITALKSSEETRNIPVIFVTKLDDNDSIEKGLKLGAADYITKPFHPARVEFRVTNQIRLTEQLLKQEMLEKISRKVLFGVYTNSYYSDILSMASEFLDTSQMLLYRMEDDSGYFTCQSEWISPEAKIKTRIGEKFALKDLPFAAINSLLTDDDSELNINSNTPSFKDSMKPYRGDLPNFILIPFTDKGKLYGIFDFSREDDGRKWSKIELDFAVLFSSIVSGALLRDVTEG